jgi:hypothetical protein
VVAFSYTLHTTFEQEQKYTTLHGQEKANTNASHSPMKNDDLLTRQIKHIGTFHAEDAPNKY